VKQSLGGIGSLIRRHNTGVCFNDLLRYVAADDCCERLCCWLKLKCRC